MELPAARRRPRRAALCLGVLTSLLLVAPPAQAPAAAARPVPVAADDETRPVRHGGDAADDPAIWVNHSTRARSRIIGNDKRGALEVYNLRGRRVQRVTTSTRFWGNVDVRQSVRMGRRTRDIAAVYNGGLRLFTINRASGRLRLTTEGHVAPAPLGEGLCMYKSRHALYVFLISRAKRIRQYRILDADRDGLLQARFLREFRLSSEAEGCVVDDARNRLYVAQEDLGLWRFRARPTVRPHGVLIDRVRPRGHLVPDVEGVTLFAKHGRGFVIASAQNVDRPRYSYFAVYRRKGNGYVGSFRIASGATADACERTDGIAAHAGALGPAFPRGLFVCQDNGNRRPGSEGNQDFKLTRFDKILRRLRG